jgi:hydrophobe/amphiphile efflux-1 (HAE1) family protein
VNISAPFIRRPIATSLIMAGIFLAGIAAYPLLPVAPLPQVDFPTLQVTARLPGASPETMASSVAQPLETQIAQIPGVDQMTSQSILGVTQITVQFSLNRAIDGAAQDLQSAIDAAAGQLPHNLPSPPSARKINPADAPILIMGVHSDVLPITTVDDYAENVLSQQISQLEGVGQVFVGGQQKPAIRIQVDPAKIASLGIGLDEIASTISTATVDGPKGSIQGKLHGFTIYDNDQILSAAPWNDVIVHYTNGAPVRVRDIGRAVDGPENAQLSAWQTTGPGVLLIIFKQPGANVIDIVNRIQSELPRIMSAVPPAIKVDTIVDRTTTIKASVHDVNITLAITIVLVVAVIFAFLRNVWATIIPGITVPLALVGTAGGMYLAGFSLDNLSLMALTIAVGFVVDDAIVMLENCYRHIEAGMSPMEAAVKGSGEIGFTILSISISLVAVFIPLLLMSGIVGRLFREFALTVTMTIGVSLVVALTLTPVMCSLFLRDEKHVRHGRVYLMFERFFDGLLGAYRVGLDLVLRHQFPTLLVFFATVATSVVLYVYIPKGFFPQQDTGVIQGYAQAGQDVSFDEMSRLTHQVSATVISDPAVSGFGAFLGTIRPLNAAGMFIALKARDQRDASAEQVMARLRKKLAAIPGIRLFMQAPQDLQVGGRQTATQYQYTLQDPSLDELVEWSPKLYQKMLTLPQVTDVATDLQAQGTTVALAIDRDMAARFGIQPNQIDNVLYDAFGQNQVTQYFTQLNSYHVILEIDPKLQGDPHTLNLLYVKSPLNGQQIPLSTFAHYDTSHVGYLAVNHQGQFPAVTISYNLPPGVALGQAVDAIRKAATEIGMPRSILGTFQGTAQAFQTSLRSQPYLIAAALIAVYIILGVLYESYIHPLTILSTLPSAGVGALLILFAAHFELSLIALIGIILLIGIVKKNGIMMVDFAITAEREHNLSPEQAIRQACLLRFRPIMMTTMAALLGALPLMLGHGTGSELRQPLGFTMVGGLILSQALTLFTTPVVYLYLDRLSSGGRKREAQAKAGVEAAAGHEVRTGRAGE